MSINAAIKRIEEFKKEWTDMPVSVAKEMTRKLNELQLALYDSQHVGRDKKNIEIELNKEIKSRGLDGKANTTKGQQGLTESIHGENQAYSELIEKANLRIELLQIINSLEGENKSLEIEKLGYTNEYIEGLGLTTDIITNTTAANEQLIDTDKKNVQTLDSKISGNQEIVNLIEKQKEKAAQLGEKWSKALGIAKDLYTSFQDLADAANWDFSDELEIFGQMGVSMMDAVINAIALSAQLAAIETGAIAAGTALNTALGIVGLIVMGVQLLAAGINALSKAKQNKRAKEIEKEATLIEDLAKKYEELEKAIEKAYSVVDLSANAESAKQNLEAQIDATKRQIAVLEDAKRLSDEEEEKLKELKENLAQLEEQSAELTENVVSIATSGILDDISSTAEQFVDAWISAFSETEDGMSGLEDSFDEMLKSILKKQMSMQLVGTFVNDWKTALGKYVNEKDLVLTPEEAGLWAKEVKDSFSQVNDNLLNYANALEYEGIHLGDSNDKMSGLSAGISGITEDQADVLEAYFNAIRVSASNIDMKMDSAINEFRKLTTSGADNPIVTELSRQTTILGDIRSALDSVIGEYASKAINIRA
jgi:hypothetical protein